MYIFINRYTIYSGDVALYDENGTHLVAAIRVPRYISTDTKKHRDFLFSVTKIGKKVVRGSITNDVRGASYSIGYVYDRFWKRNSSSIVHAVEWNNKHTHWVQR